MAPSPRTNFDAGKRPAIAVRGLCKRFGNSVLYDDLHLDIPRGRFISIFGPNGCGKSTLINLMAGLMPIDGGEILFDGRPVRDVTIGYVFQNYRDALFPWMSARDNIGYALKVRGDSPVAVRQRVDELVTQFEVGFDLGSRPSDLSGGQQQLVSILRALAPRPEVMFLDEPFSALDYEMTLFIRDKLQTVFQHSGVTMLLVSHDLEEAVYLADHVLLLSKRPTRVVDIVDVGAARPRSDATLGEPGFIASKMRSLQIFQREVKR